MTNITIPPEALKAAARAAHDKWRHDRAEEHKEPVKYWPKWHKLEGFEREDWEGQARAACLAMLKAWPGVNADAVRCGTLILHLPKEPKDE